MEEGERKPVEGGVVGVELDGLRVERGGLEVVPRLELRVPLVLERRRRRNAFSAAARHRRRRQGVRGLGFWARELVSPLSPLLLLVFFSFSNFQAYFAVCLLGHGLWKQARDMTVYVWPLYVYERTVHHTGCIIVFKYISEIVVASQLTK